VKVKKVDNQAGPRFVWPCTSEPPACPGRVHMSSVNTYHPVGTKLVACLPRTAAVIVANNRLARLQLRRTAQTLWHQHSESVPNCLSALSAQSASNVGVTQQQRVARRVQSY
jgi:hypothetical protein